MKAIDKLEVLKTDLAVRHDNTHVGSGLGGNSEEFLKMLSLNNVIENIAPIKTMAIKGDTIFFDEKYLEKTPILEIRLELSKILSSYEGAVIRNERLEHIKCISIATALMSSASLRDNFLKELHFFQDMELKELLKTYAQKENQTVESFINIQSKRANGNSEYNSKKREVYSKFQKLEESSISHMEKSYWAELAKFQPYILLSVVREIIGLDKLIKYSYDDFIDGPAIVLDKIAPYRSS